MDIEIPILSTSKTDIGRKHRLLILRYNKISSTLRAAAVIFIKPSVIAKHYLWTCLQIRTEKTGRFEGKYIILYTTLANSFTICTVVCITFYMYTSLTSLFRNKKFVSFEKTKIKKISVIFNWCQFNKKRCKDLVTSMYFEEFFTF